jgi:hypothetical protein
MTKISKIGAVVSAPGADAAADESSGLEEPDDHLGAAVMAMDLRQSLQVIVSAHDVLTRSLRGGAARAQLALIESAATRLAGAVDQLVEALRLQEASTRVHHDPVHGRLRLGAPPRRRGSSATCSCFISPIG